MDRRIGQFTLTAKEIHEHGSSLFAALQFIPLRAECHGYRECYDYIGVSPYFEPLGAGLMAPYYDVEFTGEDELVVSRVKILNGPS